MSELQGEKIDIVAWDNEPARFVCNALAPAEVIKVIIREREHAMEVVVPDDRVRDVLDAVVDAAFTGEAGDGKVFVTTIDEAIRIRTGETGADALR